MCEIRHKVQTASRPRNSNRSSKLDAQVKSCANESGFGGLKVQLYNSLDM